jgi:predicted Rossmann-fold nucleotide-binding protein
MNDLCDGVITARGFGTLEEFLKCLRAQRTSQKPIAVLNTNGFYDALLVLLETMKERLLKEVNYQMLLVSDDEDLLNQMKIM